MSTEAKCPFTHTAGAGPSNRDWWPNQLNLKILRQSDPMGSGGAGDRADSRAGAIQPTTARNFSRQSGQKSRTS